MNNIKNNKSLGCKYLQPISITVYDLFYEPFKSSLFINSGKSMITSNLIFYNMAKLTDLQREFIISLIKNCVDRENILKLYEHCILGDEKYCKHTCPYKMMLNIFHATLKCIENNGSGKLLLDGKFPIKEV